MSRLCILAAEHSLSARDQDFTKILRANIVDKKQFAGSKRSGRWLFSLSTVYLAKSSVN